MSLGDRLFYALQQALPTHLLSTLMHGLAESELPWLKSLLIRLVARSYGITLDDAQLTDFTDFPSFNAFFTRALKPDARPLAAEPALLSPVDGTISQLGQIHTGQIFQAKGHSYSTRALLGGHEDLAAAFDGGEFATIYLAPNNYHRIHMPLTGQATEAVYVPGRLFSVNPATVRACPGLFARNERLCLLFETACGPLALVMVGALFVGSLESLPTGRLTPPHGGAPNRFVLPAASAYARGAEIGRFNMGSTVILLSAPGAWTWDPSLAGGSALRLGQSLGQLAAG